FIIHSMTSRSRVGSSLPPLKSKVISSRVSSTRQPYRIGAGLGSSDLRPEHGAGGRLGAGADRVGVEREQPAVADDDLAIDRDVANFARARGVGDRAVRIGRRG